MDVSEDDRAMAWLEGGGEKGARMRSFDWATILMELPAAVAVLRGPRLVFELANQRYCELVGNRDLVGRPGRDALPELAAQGAWDLLERVYATGEPFAAREHAAQLARRDGGVPDGGYFDWIAKPTRAPDGAIDGILIFAVEVTASVNARRELEQARTTEAELRRAAEAASRAKDEFLAMLGHELRNPLAPIASALGLLELNGGPELAREREVIARQVQHLTRLVDDLLDVSRITRGTITLELRRLELHAAVARALEMASPLLEARRHRVTVDVARDGLTVDGDPGRLAQVISNLLSNAAKYTPSGGDILVAAAREGDRVVLRVRDTGVGIAPEMLPHVFERFVQERQSIDRAQGGLGLGLTIVERLVTAHGGEVEARSAGRGAGTEVIVRLPAAAGPPARPTPAFPMPAVRADTRHRVLVVDDNTDAADMLAELLDAAGHDSRVVYDAAAALRAFAEFAPDVALVDLGLPVMDGYELASRLRAADRHGALRLVAVTGYGQDNDRARARAAGFDAHLVKPVAIDRVVALIDELAAAR